MPNIIEDAGGRWYEVLAGSLRQQEQYVFEWQDLAAQIDEQEVAMGLDRHAAVDAALTAAGRRVVYVRRVPNGVDPTASDGVSRVLLWNTNGRDPTPGFLQVALERPSVAFYERVRDAEAAAQQAALSAEVAAASAADALDVERMADRLAFAETGRNSTLLTLRAEVIDHHAAAYAHGHEAAIAQAKIDDYPTVAAAAQFGAPTVSEIEAGATVRAARAAAQQPNPTPPIAPASLPGEGTDARANLVSALSVATTFAEQQAAWLNYGSTALGIAPPV